MAQPNPQSAPARVQPFTDEPIALLDDSGRWSAPFAPGLDDQALRRMYADLVTARLLDERLEKLLRTGRITFVASARGHEAAQVGMAHAMRRGHDWLFPYYRDTGTAAALYAHAELLAQYQATRCDTAKGRQMPAHPGSVEAHVFTTCSSIASQIPPAVGMAMAAQLLDNDEVTVVSFGEGATSEGDWAAAFNLASARKAPVVFVCQNNGYAISVNYAKQTGSKRICDRAQAYDMPGYLVDGMDAMAVYHSVHQAIEDARAGQGPALVEALVYRYGPHSSDDDDTVYRSREEVERWQKRDPLPRFRAFLESRNLWDAEQEEALYQDTAAELAETADRVAASGEPPVDWMFDDVYAERPWHLQEQSALVRAEQEAGG